MRIVMVLVVLGQAAAWAQGSSPGVAPFPLEIIRPANLSEKQRDELQAAYKAVLRRSGVVLPDSVKLTAALKELKRTDCDRDDECLAKLARLSGTLYGVFASVDLTVEGNVVAFGRVVRDDGKRFTEVGRAAQVKVSLGKESFSTVAPGVLGQLFEQMKLAQLPLAKEAMEPTRVDVKPEPRPDVPVAAPVVEVPPPPMPPMVAAEGPSGMKVAGWTMAGVGVVAAVAGAVVLALAPVPGVDANGNVLAQEKGQVAAARTQQTAGVAMLAGGAGVALVGALMVALSPSAEGSAKVSVFPVNGGAVAVVGGAF